MHLPNLGAVIAASIMIAPWLIGRLLIPGENPRPLLSLKGCEVWLLILGIIILIASIFS